MVNLTTRCLGLCPEEQTVLQLQALGLHLSPLGWRNVSVQRLPGGSTATAERPIPTAGRGWSEAKGARAVPGVQCGTPLSVTLVRTSTMEV